MYDLFWQRLRGRITSQGFSIHFVSMSFAFPLMMGAGYLGTGMLLGVEAKSPVASGSNSTNDPANAAADSATMIARGHQLYLMNCAHCHAPDATGDEGPDLHGVKKSDARIAAMVKNGVKGEMPKFGTKLSDNDVECLIAFIRSLD